MALSELRPLISSLEALAALEFYAQQDRKVSCRCWEEMLPEGLGTTYVARNDAMKELVDELNAAIQPVKERWATRLTNKLRAGVSELPSGSIYKELKPV